MTTVLVTIANTIWIAALVYQIGSAILAACEPARLRKQAKRQDQPPVSILIPVKDAYADTEAAFVSAFAQEYPQFEVLISAASAESSALALGRQVAARASERVRLVKMDSEHRE